MPGLGSVVVERFRTALSVADRTRFDSLVNSQAPNTTPEEVLDRVTTLLQAEPDNDADRKLLETARDYLKHKIAGSAEPKLALAARIATSADETLESAPLVLPLSVLFRAHGDLSLYLKDPGFPQLEAAFKRAKGNEKLHDFIRASYEALPAFLETQAKTDPSMVPSARELLPEAVLNDDQKNKVARYQAALLARRVLEDGLESNLHLYAGRTWKVRDILLNPQAAIQKKAAVQVTVPALHALGVYIGLPGAALSNLGVLPGGKPGQRLVAFRYIIRERAAWSQHNWRAALARKGAQEPELKSLTVMLDAVAQMSARLTETSPAKGAVDYFPALKSWDGNFPMSEEVIEFLIRCEAAPKFRLEAEEAFRVQAEKLYKEDPAFLDRLYLATYDLSRYPRRQVSAGQLKGVIVADKGEMGVKITEKTIAAGLRPAVLYNAATDSESVQVKLAAANNGILIPLEGDFAESYSNYFQVADKVRAKFQELYPQTWREELALWSMHPGYGALAESEQANLTFREAGIPYIAPAGDAIQTFGSKAGFKRAVEEINPDLITAWTYSDSTDPEVIAQKIEAAIADGTVSLPLRLKADFGGGGRGQKSVFTPDSLRSGIVKVVGEIASNRWGAGILAEIFVKNSMHLEVQVFADPYGEIVICDMRDCSNQRIGQKIQEEARPALLKNYPELVEQIYPVVLKTAREAGYSYAGTWELMFKDGKIYFLEVNPRIQVEHPVSEAIHFVVYGEGDERPLDLVTMQIQNANGKPIGFKQEQLKRVGVGLEFRINAEAWDPKGRYPDEEKLGAFLRNGIAFKEIHVPTEAEVLGNLRLKGVNGIKKLTITWECGFKAGNTMPADRDPTFGKLIIAIEAEDPSQEYELLRFASVEMLSLVRIKGDQANKAGQVSIYPLHPETGELLSFKEIEDRKEKKLPITNGPLAAKTNVADHIRILGLPISRWHAEGIDDRRHVGWVEESLRAGSNVLDESPYPPLIRPSKESGWNIPLVYAVHRANPKVTQVEPPVAFTEPERYNGVLAGYLSEMKKDGELTPTNLFGFADERHRMGATVDTSGRILSASLFNKDLFEAGIFSLETFGRPQLILVTVQHHPHQVVFNITNLMTRKNADVVVPRHSKNGSEKLIAEAVRIPGIAEPLTFALSMKGGASELEVISPYGDVTAAARPHMAKGYVERCLDLLAKLNNLTLSADESRRLRSEFQQAFVEIAIISGPITTTRLAFVKALAQSPYSLRAEMGFMSIYEHPTREIQRWVRGMADQVLFYRYYDSRFHQVTDYQVRKRTGDRPLFVGLGSFNDSPDYLVFPKPVQDRKVAWVKLEQPEVTPEDIRTALATALQALKERPEHANDVIEVMLTQTVANDDEYAALLQEAVNEVLGTDTIRRVTFNVYRKAGDSAFIPGSSCFTFRPTGKAGEPLYREANKSSIDYPIIPRHRHPMVSEQLEQWRWKEFDTQPITTGHQMVHAMEVKAIKSPTDIRVIVDMQVMGNLSPLTIKGDVLASYVAAVATGQEMEANAVLYRNYAPQNANVPLNLSNRLQQFFAWALFRTGRITRDEFKAGNLQALYASGRITNQTITDIAAEFDGTPIYSAKLEEAIASTSSELRKILATKKDHRNNRLQIFVREALNLNRNYFAFIGCHLHEELAGLNLEKTSIHFSAGMGMTVQPQVVVLSGQPTDPEFVRFSEVSTETVQPKGNYDMAVQKLNDKGQLSAEQKANAYFAGAPFKELRFNKEGLIEEKDFDPNYKTTTRGFVGMIGGVPQLILVPDTLGNKRKGSAFDRPDGDISAAIIRYRHVLAERYGKQPAFVVLESASGGAEVSNLDDPKWSGGDPLDKDGFAPKFGEHYLVDGADISVLPAGVYGGGIYDPMASDVVIGIKGATSAGLTGGFASAMSQGGKVRLRTDDGKKEVFVDFKGEYFEESLDGSTDVHGKNGVFTLVLTSERVESFLRDKTPINKIWAKLTAEEKMDLERQAIREAAYHASLLSGDAHHLTGGRDFTTEDIQAPQKQFAAYIANLHEAAAINSIRGNMPLRIARNNAMMDRLMQENHGESPSSLFPDLKKTLAGMALKDASGNPVFRVWNESWADDLLCGWMALPVEQPDGSVKSEIVSFMFNDSRGKNAGSITVEASQKAAKFLKLNSKKSMPMWIGAGSPGFKSDKPSEAKGIEIFGAAALEEIIKYQGAMIATVIQGSMGGADIFMAAQYLRPDGGRVRDALQGADMARIVTPDEIEQPTNTLNMVRIAALTPEGTLFKNKTALGQIADDAERDAAANELKKLHMPAGDPLRSQTNGHVREVIDAHENILQYVSSGLNLARQNISAYRQTVPHLDRWGVQRKIVEVANGSALQTRLPNGKTYSSEELIAFVQNLKAIQDLALGLGLEAKIDPLRVVALVNGEEVTDVAQVQAIGLRKNPIAALEALVAGGLGLTGSSLTDLADLLARGAERLRSAARSSAIKSYVPEGRDDDEAVAGNVVAAPITAARKAALGLFGLNLIVQENGHADTVTVTAGPTFKVFFESDGNSDGVLRLQARSELKDAPALKEQLMQAFKANQGSVPIALAIRRIVVENQLGGEEFALTVTPNEILEAPVVSAQLSARAISGLLESLGGAASPTQLEGGTNGKTGKPEASSTAIEIGGSVMVIGDDLQPRTNNLIHLPVTNMQTGAAQMAREGALARKLYRGLANGIHAPIRTDHKVLNAQRAHVSARNRQRLLTAQHARRVRAARQSMIRNNAIRAIARPMAMQAMMRARGPMLGLRR